MAYFYDSYAIIEFLDGNQKFRKYFTEHKGLLTELNLMEVSYSLQKHFGFKSTEKHLAPFLPYIVSFDLSDIDGAMRLRLDLEKDRRLNISYVDALGYYLARKHRAMFLTGDIHFKNLENVEFVR